MSAGFICTCRSCNSGKEEQVIPKRALVGTLIPEGRGSALMGLCTCVLSFAQS